MHTEGKQCLILWYIECQAFFYEYILGFPSGSAGEESACNVGGLGLILGLGRSPGEGKGYPLQYSGLENSKVCIVHEVPKGQTGQSDFCFRFPLRMLNCQSHAGEW